jgi:hypothetical protein
MSHLSDSSVQQAAESLIRKQVAEYVGKPLTPMSVKLGTGAPVQVDGVAADESVFVEIFAHHGALKGGQRHKVATDALKLITVGRRRADAQLILAFADEAAAAFATKGTWMAQALATWGVKVLVVDLEADVRAGILAAQARQVMVNPEAAPPPEASDD